MDARDIALQTISPTVMVPKFGKLDPMESNGQRFLAAHNGLWYEVKRTWMTACVPLALQTEVRMPYGKLSQRFEFAFDKLPSNLLEEFIAFARTKTPIECAAWFIWNESTNTFHMKLLNPVFSSSETIEYECPDLEVGEHLVVDIHSHGDTHAFFSPLDDGDDVSVKFAVVVGNLDREEVTIKSRLCLNGTFVDSKDLMVETPHQNKESEHVA